MKAKGKRNQVLKSSGWEVTRTSMNLRTVALARAKIRMAKEKKKLQRLGAYTLTGFLNRLIDLYGRWKIGIDEKEG